MKLQKINPEIVSLLSTDDNTDLQFSYRGQTYKLSNARLQVPLDDHDCYYAYANDPYTSIQVTFIGRDHAMACLAKWC